MSALLRIVEALTSRIKGDPSYRIRLPYSTRQLIYVLCYRALELLRGHIFRVKFGSSRSPVFCGRRVVIEHGYKVRCGPGLIIEDGVHINALSENGIVLGRNVTIGKSAILICTGVIASRGLGISIGDYSSIGAQSFLGGQGGISIGNNVIMGAGVRIFSENHNFSNAIEPIRLQGETRKGVTIEDNCWIGASVTIVDGVHIGKGVVIGAGSVVTSTLPENSLAVGVPARIVRKRV